MLLIPMARNTLLSSCAAITNILRTPSGFTKGMIPSMINTRESAVKRSAHIINNI